MSEKKLFKKIGFSVALLLYRFDQIRIIIFNFNVKIYHHPYHF